MRRLITAVAAAAVLHGLAPPISAQEVHYSGSVEWATGDYIFTQRTHTVSFYNGVNLTAGRVRLSAGLPLVVQNSGAVTLVGRWLVPTGGSDYMAVRQRAGGQKVPMGRRNGADGGGGAAMAAQGNGQGQGQGPGDGTGQDGTGSDGGGAGGGAPVLVRDTVLAPGPYETHLGDPSFGATVEVLQGRGTLRSVELGAWAKAPVASLESGVGTGAWDAGAGASLTLAAGRVLIFGDLGWWRYGDLPDMELRDGLVYGAAVGGPVGRRGSLLLSFSGADAVVEGVDAYASLSLMGGYEVAERLRLTVGIGGGLTESASAFTAFLGWRVGLRPLAGR